MALPTRLRLLRLLRRQRWLIAAMALLAGAGLVWWSQPVRVDPAQLLTQQPPAAGIAPEALAWPLDGEGHLQPHAALRQRFDRLLVQADVSAAREMLAQQARTELRPEQVEAVLRLWDAYLSLQQHPWQVAVDLQRPETWSGALAERQALRRERLGEDWAEAFYGADEQRVREFVTQESGAQP